MVSIISELSQGFGYNVTLPTSSHRFQTVVYGSLVAWEATRESSLPHLRDDSVSSIMQSTLSLLLGLIDSILVFWASSPCPSFDHLRFYPNGTLFLEFSLCAAVASHRPPVLLKWSSIGLFHIQLALGRSGFPHLFKFARLPRLWLNQTLLVWLHVRSIPTCGFGRLDSMPSAHMSPSVPW